MSLKMTDLDRFKKLGAPDPSYQPDTRRFYSPWDDVHSVILALIGEVRSSFVLSMFGFDDDDAAAAIDVILKNSDIYAQITLDSSQAGGVHEHALLEKYKNEYTGNSVAIGRSEKGQIIHRKMMIINGIWLVTGSTNWSDSGEKLQDNELTVTNNAIACAEARHLLDLSHDKALKDQAKRTSARIAASFAPPPLTPGT